ncbi:MAG: putative hydrolase [Cyanobacteria bacterium RYN_339]|nr:putative hydrolase [Cyanobacteria bacterium RYN_339]
MLATQRLERLAGELVFQAMSLPDEEYLTDLHLHTDYTDGRSGVAAMLDAAVAAGLRAVAFTEHVRRGVAWLPTFHAEVRRERATRPGLRVLVGIEAKALDLYGGLDADEEAIASADLVLGAFHNYPDGLGGFVSPRELDATTAAKREYEASWALLEHAEVDVLAHPGALTRKKFGSFPDELTRQLVRKAGRQGRAIELNGEYADADALAALLRWCREEDVWVTLGSNAHHADEVGRIGRMVKEVLAHAG